MSGLEVAGLWAGYGAGDVVHDVRLEIRQGEWVAVIGANGAGKSTLLNAIIGMVSHRRGFVRYKGERIDNLRPADVMRRGIALVPEGRQVFADLSVDDNLLLGTYSRQGRARRDVAADFERVFALFPILLERRRQFAGTLSGGEQQMLAIGRALAAKPDLLLLDEPSLGLAPRVVDQIYQALATLHGQGVSVLLVEQNAMLALDTAMRGYILAEGRIVQEGPAAALAEAPAVRHAYLGGGQEGKMY
ncbi:MAG: ABC transporter ATP-binding protein [Candidatus Rokuibacteriota bacterium]